MKKYKALETNNTLKYTKGIEYEAKMSQECSSILFISNDNGDNVVVNRYDFECVKNS